MRVILAKPRGFCAGVERAIEAVERALQFYGPPVYVRHEIVHNGHVVDQLRAKGAVFVEALSEIPDGGITVFSAHGVSRRVENEAKARSLPVVDATCPLVSRVHNEASRHSMAGREVVLIGHAGHPEVEGTLGRVDGVIHLISTPNDVGHLMVSDPRRLAYVTQTTLSVDDTRAVIEALRARFPGIVGPGTRDICYATQNRQQAARELARLVDVVLVVGAHYSSNSNRLREVVEGVGVPAHLLSDPAALDDSWLDGVRAVGVTAGASAPEYLVEQLVERLVARGATSVETMPGLEEAVQFRKPSMPSGRRSAGVDAAEALQDSGQ